MVALGNKTRLVLNKWACEKNNDFVFYIQKMNCCGDLFDNRGMRKKCMQMSLKLVLHDPSVISWIAEGYNEFILCF